MEMITVEKRKYDYLLEVSKCNEKIINGMFDSIDKKMGKIKVGDIVYTSNSWADGFYKLEVLEIVDKENGTVKVLERGNNNAEYEINVVTLITEKDFEKGKYY